jgi:hypothetical protein
MRWDTVAKTGHRRQGEGSQMATSPRVSSEGVVLAYGVRYSWAYVVVIATAIILLVIDIIADLGDWANYVVIALIVIAVVLRPGGIRGPRHAVRAERESAEQRLPSDD